VIQPPAKLVAWSGLFVRLCERASIIRGQRFAIEISVHSQNALKDMDCEVVEVERLSSESRQGQKQLILSDLTA
jgi:hypothetical protein